jgi:hypothetical protein
MQFEATSADSNRLGLVELCQRFADEQWLLAHMLPHEAAAAVSEQTINFTLLDLPDCMSSKQLGWRESH